MDAKIYNLDEYRRKKIQKEMGIDTSNHPSRRVDRTSMENRQKKGRTLTDLIMEDPALNKIVNTVANLMSKSTINDSDPTPPHGIERPVEMYDQEKDEPQFYDQDKD